MADANTRQIAEFKRIHCQTGDTRIHIADHYNVQIESFEELLPGKSIRSYAFGSRAITRSFVVFRVTDPESDVVYYPVFSESVGRQLANTWELVLPRKMTIFSTPNLNESEVHGGVNQGVRRNHENRQMLQLIQFVRSMMILHIEEPTPMRDPFKTIYDNLYSNPSKEVCVKDVKSINTATSNFLAKKINTSNENFSNLQDYINYVRQEYPNKNLRAFDFEELRCKLRESYPNETIVF